MIIQVYNGIVRFAKTLHLVMTLLSHQSYSNEVLVVDEMRNSMVVSS